ncbi:accessory gene regulator B family protein, partial [Senegalia sp. (in: firmicutes)]
MNYIARVSNTLSNSIINSGDFQTLEKLKIRYGIECIVSELSKFIIYLLIFSLF